MPTHFTKSLICLYIVFITTAALAADKPAHRSQPQDEASHLKIVPGFHMEMIHKVDKDTEGSWVGLTVDDQGRLIACDQYGHFYRINVQGEVEVETLDIELTGAHGVLYAFDSLYVVITEDKPKIGIYRLQDTTGDDQFDKVTQIKPFKGRGEHSIHSLALSPDGQSIYFAAGNHTQLPADIPVRGSANWQEDLTTPRIWASNHAKGILAPGGFILKFNPDGSDMEMVASGFRNQFDLAFDDHGELFTFDADMEYDFGTPWYRPTRVNHVVSGAEFGWRSGSGKWPAYYPDSLPAVLDIGPGSPTGVVSGRGAKFPAKYQKALFINDWTFGTMYAIHLEADGATYKATHEEFLSGRGLPLTDVVIHPQDGNMYFTVGGRKTESALYRVRYIGAEDTTPVAMSSQTQLAKQRKSLEMLHNQGVGKEAIAQAWPSLNHRDRFIRYAARVAIEKQPVAAWQEKALAEQRPLALVEAMIALSRSSLQSDIIKALARLDYTKMDTDQFLAAVRAYQLCVVRMGNPAEADRNRVIDTLSPFYPNSNNLINRELSQLLLRLGDEKATAITVNLMLTAENEMADIASEVLISRNAHYAEAVNEANNTRPNIQQIAMAYSLYAIETGWTPELREAFFSWFPVASQWLSGGYLHILIAKMREEALTLVPNKDERRKLATLSAAPKKIIADITPAVGPPVIWTVASATQALKDNMHGRDFQRGKNLYRAQMCVNCHEFGGEGGGIGPILTQAGSRYTLQDLLENIIEPSKVISDQFGSIMVTKHDGTVLVGREAGEKAGALMLITNPNEPDEETAVPLDEIKSQKPFPVSSMPPGLIYPLNKDELADLIAYLLSAGNPDDAYFETP